MNQCYCKCCMQPVKENDRNCPHCGQDVNATSAIHHLKCGTILHGKFLVGKALGEGGFGITYIGRDLTLDMRIAIKEYYPNGWASRSNNYSNEVTMTQGTHGIDCEMDMRRFLSEARILARFSNEPGVVCVRDFFRENGTAYIVMEYLDGVTLKDYIAQYGPISPEKFFPMIQPTLQVLGDIHKAGLIHRDISPDNIMMLKNGRLKLLDFGAAREITAEKSLSIVLKPGYAPEEQYRAKGKQGSWTDVYAMCATIYKCITGKTPDESIQRVFEDELLPPSKLGVAISANQEAALMQGLSVKSLSRIQTMEALRESFFSEEIENVKTIHIHRAECDRQEKKTNIQTEKAVYQLEGDKTVSISGLSEEMDDEKTSGIGVAVIHQKTVAKEKTNENAEEKCNSVVGTEIFQHKSQETVANDPSGSSADKGTENKSKEQLTENNRVIGGKFKYFMVIGFTTLAIILAVILLQGKTQQTESVETQPTVETQQTEPIETQPTVKTQQTEPTEIQKTAPTDTQPTAESNSVRITKQPESVYAKLGEYAEISVLAEGEGLTYSWFVTDIGDTKYYLSSQSTNIYKMEMTHEQAGRKAYCIIVDKDGNSVRTNVVELLMAATIVTQPQSVTVAEQEVARVTVEAVGEELTYAWYVRDIGDDRDYLSSNQTKTYKMIMDQSNAGRTAYCVITDKYGNSVTTQTVTLFMSSP